MAGRHASACCPPPPRSSRPATGPAAGCSTGTRCDPAGCTSPSRALTGRRWRPEPQRGGELLCVAAVTPHKGHDVLLAALATVADLPWRCVCVGTLDRDPDFVERLVRQARADGIERSGALRRTAGRPTTSTPRTPPRTCWCWRRAPRRTAWWSPRRWPAGCRSSRRPSAACRRRSGRQPTAAGRACWSRPDDPAALGSALRGWLVDADLRQRLRRRGRTAPCSADRLVGDRRPDRGGAGGGGRMTTEPVRVSPAWLALREPADAAARAADLVERVQPHLPSRRPIGDPRSRLRHRIDGPLAGAPAGRPQHWVLYDWDADLLARCRRHTRPRSADGAGGHRRDPAARHHPAGSGDLAGASLITASALLDMLTADELDRFVTACGRRRLPGAGDHLRDRSGRSCAGRSAGRARSRTRSMPTSAVRSAGDGCSARTRSTPRPRRSPGCGADVLVRPSPWRLGADQAALAAEWFAGWVGAACEQHPS